jgi:acetyl esterase/lipase
VIGRPAAATTRTMSVPSRKGTRRSCGSAALGLLTALLVAACAGGGGQPATASPTSPTTFPALATSPCGDDQPGRYVEETFDVAAVETVSYSGELLVDVYRPADDPASCRTGVVWVHGGGFTQATRDSPAERAWGAALARRGYVALSIDYGLGSGEPFGLDQATTPDRQAVVAGAIADAQAALDWARTSATELGIDPGRVVIGGTSAGAMTALGAGLTAPVGQAPCGIVSISGDLEPDWVGPAGPSVLFVHGDADQLVPYQSSVDGARLVQQAGGRADLITVPGAGHEITGEPDDALVGDVTRWLREVVAPGCS